MAFKEVDLGGGIGGEGALFVEVSKDQGCGPKALSLALQTEGLLVVLPFVFLQVLSIREEIAPLELVWILKSLLHSPGEKALQIPPPLLHSLFRVAPAKKLSQVFVGFLGNGPSFRCHGNFSFFSGN